MGRKEKKSLLGNSIGNERQRTRRVNSQRQRTRGRLNVQQQKKGKFSVFFSYPSIRNGIVGVIR